MRILVVEDEYRIASSLKKGLQQERYVVDIAHTGTEGSDLAVSEDYDLVILDRRLPDLDGLDICRLMRQKHIRTPVLLLTARGQVQDRVEGLDAGADDYLVKPFSFEELLARIRALIRRPVSIQDPILTTSGLSLDTKNFTAAYHNRSVNLTSKEFALLEYLMRHPDQVLTKDQITAHVWNYDANILPNTIEVYIGALRRKIHNSFIQTVRGFGYKINS